jgi:hypothetical protein
MKVKVTVLKLFGALLFGAVSASAQSTSAIFPQLVDGFNSDGTSWQTMIYASNFSGTTASCTLSLYGIDPIRLSTPLSFTISNRNWYMTLAASHYPLAVGYARLDCSVPVTAGLIYEFVAADQSTTLASSAVFAAPLTVYAVFPAILRPGWRTALNIVNDSDIPAGYTVAFTDATGHTSTTNIVIPARVHFARFVSEILNVPPGPGLGTIERKRQSSLP